LYPLRMRVTKAKMVTTPIRMGMIWEAIMTPMRVTPLLITIALTLMPQIQQTMRVPIATTREITNRIAQQVI
jgi:hypothetical protein